MLGAVITDLIDEPRMVIRVADADLDALSEQIDTIATRRGFAGKVVLLAEPSVASGDCRIEWADGGVERDSARLWHDIDLAVARLLGDGHDRPDVSGTARHPSASS